MRKLLLAGVIFVLFPGAAVAGGGGHFSICPGFNAGDRVSMLDSCFNGTAHFAPAGRVITISNDGVEPHTFTAVDGSFDTGMLQGGEEFDLTIDRPGVYRVWCTLHGTAEGEGMAGVLVVGEPDPVAIYSGPDIAGVEEALAEVSRLMAESLDRQSGAIESLEQGQEGLLVSLQELETAPATAVPPMVVGIPAGDSSLPSWIAALGGMAVAVLMTTLVPWRRRS